MESRILTKMPWQDPRKLTVSRRPQDVPVVPPETHGMTDSAGSEFRISGRDLDPSEPMRTVPDIVEDLAPEHSDNDSVMSSRVGASEVDEGSTLEHDSEIAVEAPTPTIPVGSQVFKERIREHGFGQFARDLEDQRQFDEKCAEILVGSVGSRPCW